MRDDGPSRTAARVAMRRAAHQLLDVPPVFIDPLALRLLRPDVRETIERHPAAFERRPWSARMRAFLAVRSRVAEDALADSVAAGARQYVVLGAGLDTFGLRNADPTLRVFEVDHPATQAFKRRRLEAAQLTPPATLAFVPVDFERDDLAAALARAGFAAGEPAFVSWLGVTPYLERGTVLAALSFIAGIVGDVGGVAFDYRVPPPRFNLLRRWLLARFAARLEAAGEPFRSSFEPADVRREVERLGLAAVLDLDAAALMGRYFAGRRDGLKVSGPAHVVVARRRALG